MTFPGTARLVALAAAACALAVYLLTLAWTVTGEDSGELIAAAHTMGIPHPTGYPTWCILAKLILKIVPFGSVAWRAALLSAMLGAATVYCVVLLVVRLTQSRGAAFVAGLMLAFSFEFWEQSVIAEVYTLNAVLLILCVWLLIRWRDTHRPALLYIFALCYGLGLGNHSSMYLVIPVLAPYILWVEGTAPDRAGHYARAIAFGLLGFAVHLYLPIRSMADPAMDWGNPESWPAFWDVFTRKQYQHIIVAHPRSPGLFLRQCAEFVRIFNGQGMVGAPLLMLIGFFTLRNRGRAYAWLLAGLFTVLAMTAIVIPNFAITRKEIWINTTYWIPAYVVAAILCGAGLARLAQAFRAPRGRVVLWVGSVFLIGLPLAMNYRANDKSDYHFASDYGENVLRTLDTDAIYFGDGDHHLFPVLYYQIVEGRRPDVLVANPYGYIPEHVYADMPEDAKQGFGRIPSDRDDERIAAWLIANTNRPVYFAAKPAPQALAGCRIVDAGLLYRVVREGESVDADAIWDRYGWHTTDPADTRGDWTAELVLYDYYFARGRHLLTKGETAQALESLRIALDVADATALRLNDVGNVLAEQGLYTDAASHYQRALDLDPDCDIARLNLGRVDMARGAFGDALASFETALARTPEDATASYLAARCEAAMGDHEAARTRLERLLEAWPDDATLREQASRLLAEVTSTSETP
ncbi:MAG: DUF2723 domain-containing protein [bacterium]|nr:DUF2723 domain-containing protein [bacterium]